METFYVLLHVMVSTVNPSEPPWADGSPKTIYKNIESCEEFLDSLYQNYFCKNVKMNKRKSVNDIFEGR